MHHVNGEISHFGLSNIALTKITTNDLMIIKYGNFDEGHTSYAEHNIWR